MKDQTHTDVDRGAAALCIRSTTARTGEEGGGGQSGCAVSGRQNFPAATTSHVRSPPYPGTLPATGRLCVKPNITHIRAYTRCGIVRDRGPRTLVLGTCTPGAGARNRIGGLRLGGTIAASSQCGLTQYGLSARGRAASAPTTHNGPRHPRAQALAWCYRDVTQGHRRRYEPPHPCPPPPLPTQLSIRACYPRCGGNAAAHRRRGRASERASECVRGCCSPIRRPCLASIITSQVIGDRHRGV